MTSELELSPTTYTLRTTRASDKAAYYAGRTASLAKLLLFTPLVILALQLIPYESAGGLILEAVVFFLWLALAFTGLLVVIPAQLYLGLVGQKAWLSSRWIATTEAKMRNATDRHKSQDLAAKLVTASLKANWKSAANSYRHILASIGNGSALQETYSGRFQLTSYLGSPEEQSFYGWLLITEHFLSFDSIDRHGALGVSLSLRISDITNVTLVESRRNKNGFVAVEFTVEDNFEQLILRPFIEPGALMFNHDQNRIMRECVEFLSSVTGQRRDA